MSKVTLKENTLIKIVGSFDNYEEAQALACYVFTCAIVAIAKHPNGDYYMRPGGSKDSNIFAWAVISI
jgi:hypothetical protein